MTRVPGNHSVISTQLVSFSLLFISYHTADKSYTLNLTISFYLAGLLLDLLVCALRSSSSYSSYLNS